MKLNMKKCELRLDEINFMGHRVTSEGLKPDERKIEAILKTRQMSREFRGCREQ